MTGYLERRIARANGLEAVVRPLLMPAFADRDDIALRTEPFAETAPVKDRDLPREPERPAYAPATLPEPRSPARSTMEGLITERADLRPHSERYAPPRQHRAHDPEPPNAAPAPARRTSPAQAPRIADAAGAEPPPPAARAPQALAASAAPIPAFTSTADEFRSIAAAPARVPTSATAEPSPVVRITIGRVEIRANLPRTAFAAPNGGRPAQPVRRLSVAPKLTLEDYLNRREPHR